MGRRKARRLHCQRHWVIRPRWMIDPALSRDFDRVLQDVVRVRQTFESIIGQYLELQAQV